jgi:basic amino acid/polyamine antiporter, APA family
MLDERRKKAGAVAENVSATPLSKFKTPYVNSRFIIPALFMIAVILFVKFYPGGMGGFLSSADEHGRTGWIVWREKVPYILFAIVFFVMTILSFVKRLSLIPVLGFLCCTYLLCESGTTNWERFLVWLVIGLVLYFVYGRKHSKLGAKG